MPMSEATANFFRERWEEKAEEDEEGLLVKPENRNITTYLEMKEAIKGDEDLARLGTELEASVLRYAETMVKLYQSQLETEKEEIQESDRGRRLAHNALLSSLKTRARAYVKKKGANYWRLKIDDGQDNRDAIRIWATEIAPFISDKIIKFRGNITRHISQ